MADLIEDIDKLSDFSDDVDDVLNQGVSSDAIIIIICPNPYIPSVTFHCHWKADIM